jgi:hypothetical protein
MLLGRFFCLALNCWGDLPCPVTRVVSVQKLPSPRDPYECQIQGRSSVSCVSLGVGAFPFASVLGLVLGMVAGWERHGTGVQIGRGMRTYGDGLGKVRVMLV